MFAYCGNNPVNRADPSGEIFLTTTIAGVALWKLGLLVVGLIASCLIIDSVQTGDSTVVLPNSISKTKNRTKETIKTEDVVKTIKLPPRDPVHHIVAQNDRRAAESRAILEEVDINPKTDLKNLIILPASYHISLHTEAYHAYVTQRLRLVRGNRDGVEATLASLKFEILVRSLLGIRWE